MKCPFCNAENTRVIDSRPADDAFSIRRRRQCDVCDRRFTTYEKVETMPLALSRRMTTGNLIRGKSFRTASYSPAISVLSLLRR